MNNKHEQAFLANDLADAKVKKAVDLPYEALPLVSAVCPCGYKGKSKQPQYYRCGYCYHAGRAKPLRAVPSRKSGLVFPAKSGSTTKA